MNISKANAKKLGQILADALEICDNPEQRSGVLKARDLISDGFSPMESDMGWKRYLHFSAAFSRRTARGTKETPFDDFTLDNGVKLSAYTRGDRAYFTGSSTGEHSISFNGDLSRLREHWAGYKANAQQAYERYINRSPA